MLRLKKVNLTFDREIIRDGEMTIPEGGITVITGESGSGKTSLLYMLGLVSSNEKYLYEMDGALIDLSDRKAVSKLQREKIGFLFQDGSFIESLTVGENIKWAAKLAGETVEEADVSSLLNEVELTENVKNSYPLQLSGGEQQRVSLAMVMAKKTRYILADEPTSALDEKNAANLIRILRKLASKGSTVVIATHNTDICKVADNIYHIENHKINLQKESLNTDRPAVWKTEKTDKMTGKDLFDYARAVKRKGKWLSLLLTIFCAVAIAGFALANNVLNYMNNIQQELLNQVSDREIFLTSQISSTNREKRDCDGNFVISKEEFDRIKKIDGVDRVYPLFELRSFSVNGEEIVTDNAITVTAGNRSYTVNYSLNNGNLLSYYIVLPYFPEQKYEKQLYKSFESEEAVYISYELAEDLNLIEDQTTALQLDYQIGVPIKKYVDTVSENDEEVFAHIDIAEFTPMHVSVAGILNSNVINRYTINGNKVIYVPYDRLNDWVSQFAKNSKMDFSKYASYDLMDWGASACVIYTNSYKNIDVVKEKVENINSHFSTRYDYQDAETIDLMMQNVSNVSKMIVTLVIVIVFVLMTVIFVHSTMARKREYAILKANGMTAASLRTLTVIESVSNGIKIFFIALVLAIILSSAFGMVLFHAVKFLSFETYIFIFLFAIAFVTLPSVLCVIYVSRIKVDRILRD